MVVRLVRAGQGPAATWLRHGEHPAAALCRLDPDGQGEPLLLGASSQVRDLVEQESGSVRVHAIGVTYRHRAAGESVMRAGSVSADDASDNASAVLPGEPLPTDLVDHLAGAPAATQAGAGSTGDRSSDREEASPLKVQRTGAYAIVRDGDQILLTRLRGTQVWTLPGGGVDFGEHPAAAVCREVYEEAGLQLQGVQLVEAGSDHWVGRAPDGRLEDFHAVRVLYRASVAPGGVPRVVEIAGSTEEAAWVRLAALDQLQLGQSVHGVRRHLT